MTRGKEDPPSVSRQERSEAWRYLHPAFDLSKDRKRPLPTSCHYPFGIAPPAKKANRSSILAASRQAAQQNFEEPEFLIHFHTRNLPNSSVPKPNNQNRARNRTSRSSIYFDPKDPTKSLFEIKPSKESPLSPNSVAQLHDKDLSQEREITGQKRLVWDSSAYVTDEKSQDRTAKAMEVTELNSETRLAEMRQLVRELGPESLNQCETISPEEQSSNAAEQNLIRNNSHAPKLFYYESSSEDGFPPSFEQEFAIETASNQEDQTDDMYVDQRGWPNYASIQEFANMAYEDDLSVLQNDHANPSSIQLHDVETANMAYEDDLGILQNDHANPSSIQLHDVETANMAYEDDLGILQNEHTNPSSIQRHSELSNEADTLSESLKQISEQPKPVKAGVELKVPASTQRDHSQDSLVPAVRHDTAKEDQYNTKKQKPRLRYIFGAKQITLAKGPSVLSGSTASNESSRAAQKKKQTPNGQETIASIERTSMNRHRSLDISFEDTAGDIQYLQRSFSTHNNSSSEAVPGDIVGLQPGAKPDKKGPKQSGPLLDDLSDLFDGNGITLEQLPEGFFDVSEIPWLQESFSNSGQISFPGSSKKGGLVTQEESIPTDKFPMINDLQTKKESKVHDGRSKMGSESSSPIPRTASLPKMKCPKCAEIFCSVSRLERHIYTVHRSTLKRCLSCPRCNSCLCDHSIEPMHSSFCNTQGSHHVCVHCKLIYPNEEELLQHIAARHPYGSIPCVMGALRVEEQRDSSKHSCSVCGRQYSTKGYLNSHIMNKHAEEYLKKAKLVVDQRGP